MDPEEYKDQFLDIYDRYASDLYRFCLLKVSRREVAEDLTQEVFMKYWQQVRQGTEIGNDRALLYTIARNLVIDWYRKKKEQSLDSMAEQGIEFGTDDHKTITEHVAVREVLAVIGQLDEPSREAMTLRFVDGLSPADIAEITGETANTISVRLNRAVKKVQELMHVHD